jgi:acyl-coenzyme A thioesterase PaaI-like protein
MTAGDYEPIESWDAEAFRETINRYPPYVGAEIQVTCVANDASEIRVEMPLTERNVNVVGTHFGGSLYAMVDPHLMLLLKRRLGPGYIVWDRSARIDFLRPARSRVRATIRLTDEELEAIRSATATGEKHLPQWQLEIRDSEDEIVATVLKTLYVRKTAD